MTKEEIIKLLDRKIKEAEQTSNENHGNNSWAFSSHYSGVAEGLRYAKGLIGMLNKRNKISNA